MRDLRTLRLAVKRRDEAQTAILDGIVAAREDGFPWTAIADAAGFSSRQVCERAARRHNGGTLPVPRQRSA